MKFKKGTSDGYSCPILLFNSNVNPGISNPNPYISNTRPIKMYNININACFLRGGDNKEKKFLGLIKIWIVTKVLKKLILPFLKDI